MRYIDIGQLQVEPDWATQARALADRVRNLPDADRIKVINANQKIWKDLKEKLKALSHDKCWYCESVDARSDNAVDHFRPKGNVRDSAPPHLGYWWLAFDWKNYRFSCTFCNSLRNSATTSGGKHDYFPLWDETKRARSETDSLDDEIPLLIDPANAYGFEMIAFADDGSVGPAYSEREHKLKHHVGLATVKHYHLSQPTLTERRLKKLRQVREWIDEADKHLERHAKHNDGYSLSTARARLRDLLGAASSTGEYSMAVKHLLAGMATRSEAAKQVLAA